MNFLLISIASVFVLVLYITSFNFRFYIHPLLNIITHGVTGGKLYFLLIYSSISFFMLFFSKKKITSFIDKENLWKKRLFFLFVFLGMASSICSYLYYTYRYTLSLQAYHYHFKEIYNSVNFFPHIHTSKLFIFIVSKTFGFGQLFRGMDNGRVFEGSIPIFFPYMTLISIISTIILSFFLIRNIVYKWDKKYQTGISLITVIAFSSVMKTMSDGGPFSYDFLVGISVIWIITSSKGPYDILSTIKKRWRVFFWCFFSVFSFMCLIDPSFEIFTYTIKNCIGVFIVYFGIYLLTIRDTLKKRWQLSIFIFPMIFFSYTVYMRYVTYVKPFEAYLEKGTQINYFYYKDSPLPKFLKTASIIFDSEFFTIFTFTTKEKTKPIEIYKALNENPFRNRHIAIIMPKKRQAYGIIGDILFLDFKNNKTSLKVPRLLHLKLTKKNSSKEKFDAEIAFDTTYFPALSHVEEGRITQLDENHKFVMYYFLNRLFYYYGINEYILTPVAFYKFN